MRPHAISARSRRPYLRRLAALLIFAASTIGTTLAGQPHIANQSTARSGATTVVPTPTGPIGPGAKFKPSQAP